MNYLNKTTEILQSLITIILFTLMPLVTFTLITSKHELLGFKSFVVLTGSMGPSIEQGSIVFIKKSNSYQAGDVIAFEQGTLTITHRIVEVQDDQGKIVSPLISPLDKKPEKVFYKTKGDANSAADSKLVTKDQIVGKAQFYFPYLGKLVVSLKTIPGFLLLIVGPTIIFILMELWKIKGEVEKNIEKKFLERMGSI